MHPPINPGRRRGSLLLLILANFLASGRFANAEELIDRELGFTLQLPPGSIPRPDLKNPGQGIKHAYQIGELEEGIVPTFLMIKPIDEVIRRNSLRIEDLPPGVRGTLFTTTWKGFTVDGIEIPQEIRSLKTVALNVNVPLKKQAIQLDVFGPAESRQELHEILRQSLDNLQGESNWVPSLGPISLSEDAYVKVLFVGAILAGLAGLILLWLISQKCEADVIFIIAGVVYAGSFPLDHFRIRELKLAVGLMRMFAIAAVLLGIIDRSRKSKEKREKLKPAGPVEPCPDEETPSS